MAKIRAYLLTRNGRVQRYLFRSRKSAQNNPRYITKKQAQKLQKLPQTQREELFFQFSQTARAKRASRPGPSAPAPGAGAATTIINKPSGRRGAKFTTWFKALGTMGFLKDMRGAESPDLLSDDLEDFNAPAAFYSNQAGLLGQVRFRGAVPLELLIDRLNIKLQFAGEESSDFDFRDAYARWEYKYQVVETIGPTDRVIEERRDRNG